MKFFVIILFVCIISFNISYSSAQSAANPDTKEAVGYINTFFNIYKTQSSDKAFDYISTKNTPLIISPDQLSVLKGKLDSVNAALGNFVGYELIYEKKVAASLVLFSYLVKHKNHPIRFTFIFYKPEEHWLIYNIQFDADDMIEELKQSSKIVP